METRKSSEVLASVRKIDLLKRINTLSGYVGASLMSLSCLVGVRPELALVVFGGGAMVVFTSTLALVIGKGEQRKLEQGTVLV